jgi:hypothetical protein
MPTGRNGAELEEEGMDRERFEHLLAAYGADFSRWPADERGAAALYASQHEADVETALRETRALDAVLDQAREPASDTLLLAQRIIASAPRPSRWALDAGALVALAACAAFGVVLGYGGGLLAPPPIEDGAYFALAFEAPADIEDDG